MTSANGAADAPDPDVGWGQADPAALQAQRDAYADEAEAAVGVIEAKLAGIKDSLATAKAEAKRLRAEANRGGGG